METATNTRSKKTAVAIQTDKVAHHADGDEEEYEDDEERAVKVPEYDAEALDKWLGIIYPKISQLLEQNITQKVFDSYEVFWEEERGEVELWQKLQTNFDFKEANKATQKAINQVKAASNDNQKDDQDDDWESGNT